MKCVIIASGEVDYTSDIAEIIRGAQLIISADGGARHLRALNILPHVMMGDFDSISAADNLFFERMQVEKITFPSRKDQTDSEICVSWALGHNATDITLLGVTGTRLDHTLANIFLLTTLARKHIPARIINKTNELHIITDKIELKGRPGDLLSIIPVTQTVTGVTLKGLEYPLEDARIEMGSCLGISNVFNESTARVSIKQGILMVIKSRD